tara:strand:- start:2058 stop:3209 length:1152 start_codon:yes stop_codon:yes gene_type:complete
MKKINLVIFGATGSIGSSVLEIVKKNLDKFHIEGITCNRRLGKLLNIAKKYNIKKIGFNKKSIKNLKLSEIKNYDIYDNLQDFNCIISKKTDVIIFGISGLQSLDLFINILKSGKKVGIANKECIISLGNKFKEIANKNETEIVPLDSEHNSIYHLLKINECKFKSVTITATGGPFLKRNKKDLKKITLEQALRHPIWKMGKKISIDSATMMNKALELIEARYLFNLKINEVNSIIHPQAVIHAFVNYENGISTALINEPDMKIPIASLFFGFNRFTSKKNSFDIYKYPKLDFMPIDTKRFPSIKLSYEVMKIDGLAPNVFNYLNEKLVNYFINGRIGFNDIVALNEINLERVFSKNRNISNPSYTDIKNINNWIDNNLYLGN